LGTKDHPHNVIALNAYFERSVEAVQRKGGEVLKFIGDGMLAIFPVTDKISAAAAAEAALQAARDALASIGLLNGKEGRWMSRRRTTRRGFSGTKASLTRPLARSKAICVGLLTLTTPTQPASAYATERPS
jgi:hypothetical protein